MLPCPMSETVYKISFRILVQRLVGTLTWTIYNKFSYYITFVDTYSRFTRIYLLKSKLDAYIAFKHFEDLVELQFNT